MPVLATIAASDMKLMSEAEVSKILDAPIFTKAERIVSKTHMLASIILSFSIDIVTTERLNCYFSLFEGTASNTTDTVIDNDHKSKQAHFGNDFPEYVHFKFHRPVGAVDYFASYDIDAGNGLEKPTSNTKEWVNMILMEIN